MSLQTRKCICPGAGQNRMWKGGGGAGGWVHHQLLVVFGQPRIMLGSTTSEHLEKSLVSVLVFWIISQSFSPSKPGQMEAILCSGQTHFGLLSAFFLLLACLPAGPQPPLHHHHHYHHHHQEWLRVGLPSSPTSTCS